MFTTAIIKTPCENMIHGLTTAGLGQPDYELALAQHEHYRSALKECGLEVRVLDPDERYPDSVFIEDVALCTPECAIITRPGARSRRGEIEAIIPVLGDYYTHIEYVQAPGTVDAGDILQVDSHYVIGLSQRTNENGAQQVLEILNRYGKSGTTVKLDHVLHLKTGVAYLGHNLLVVSGEFVNKPEFQHYRLIEIEPDESYAANCIRINDRVLLPKGFPKASHVIKNAGLPVVELDVSEFRKLDGGLSCLSLRF